MKSHHPSSSVHHRRCGLDVMMKARRWIRRWVRTSAPDQLLRHRTKKMYTKNSVFFPHHTKASQVRQPSRKHHSYYFLINHFLIKKRVFKCFIYSHIIAINYKLLCFSAESSILIAALYSSTSIRTFERALWKNGLYTSSLAQNQKTNKTSRRWFQEYRA